MQTLCSLDVGHPSYEYSVERFNTIHLLVSENVGAASIGLLLLVATTFRKYWHFTNSHGWFGFIF